MFILEPYCLVSRMQFPPHVYFRNQLRCAFEVRYERDRAGLHRKLFAKAGNILKAKDVQDVRLLAERDCSEFVLLLVPFESVDVCLHMYTFPLRTAINSFRS